MDYPPVFSCTGIDPVGQPISIVTSRNTAAFAAHDAVLGYQKYPSVEVKMTINTVRRSLVGLAAVATAGTVATVVAPAASADPVSLQHAIIVCQSASFYDNVPSSGAHLTRILSYGDKVGHTRGAHSIYKGWAATFDYGPNDWAMSTTNAWAAGVPGNAELPIN